MFSNRLEYPIDSGVVTVAVELGTGIFLLIGTSELNILGLSSLSECSFSIFSGYIWSAFKSEAMKPSLCCFRFNLSLLGAPFGLCGILSLSTSGIIFITTENITGGKNYILKLR